MTLTLFTRKETAEMFGIKPRTLWHWQKRNLIKPALYIGNRPRYTLEEIERVAESFGLNQENNSEPKPAING